MKKLFLILILFACSSFVFSEPFENAEQIVEDFYQMGEYIKIIENKNNVLYLSKSTIISIAIDEDDMEIANIDSDLEYDVTSFNIRFNNITSDNYGNIIIERKNIKK